MELAKHAGGCHCGKVRFEIDAPAKFEIGDCNCSMCARTAYQHLFVKKQNFRLLTSWEDITDYQFNTRVARHLFCRHCGIKSFYVPRSHPDGYSVNVRCLDEGTFEITGVRPVDGRNWERHYPEGRGQY
jgi:hypothetical protein